MDMNQRIQKAVYQEQVLSEYQGNPLIEALPNIWSEYEVAEKAPYHEGERLLDAHFRMHCIQRLFRYFQPLEQHMDIEQRISRCIRQGYLNRNPCSRDYARVLSEGYAAIIEGKGFYPPKSYSPTATGFTIIGLSGVGKSKAIEKVLSLYPQCIQHTYYKGLPLQMTQIVWLKLDCPYDGSIRGLCLQFFDAIDRALGTSHFPKYTQSRYTIDMIMLLMTQMVNLYQIGLLVIDEIQHLSLVKGGGSEKMLNFFVTLVNTIGVPVIMIGTSKAMSILQSEFRQARRGSGQGDLLWDRMQNDTSWELFMSSMWKHQWTKKAVSLSAELSDVIYDESQGIIDIAVKLYAMVQIRAISTGEESFGPEDIREVAREKLGLVKPMLDALRTGNKKKLQRYADITPISIDDYIASYSANVEQDIPKRNKEEKISASEQTILKLLELGVDPKTAKILAGRAIATAKNFNDVPSLVKTAYTQYLQEEVPESKEEMSNDLRQLKKVLAVNEG